MFVNLERNKFEKLMILLMNLLIIDWNDCWMFYFIVFFFVLKIVCVLVWMEIYINIDKFNIS